MKESDVFANLPRLETERLLLRKLRRSDDRAVFAYGRDPEVSRHVLWDTHRHIEDSRTFIEIMLDCYHIGQVAPWAFEEKATGLMIGTGGFVNWNITHARAEVGYTLAREFWNRGFATEATRTIIAFGFTHMGLNRIEAYCDIENVGSARVMEKCGMTYEGTLRRRSMKLGIPRDNMIYSILRGEWAG